MKTKEKIVIEKTGFYAGMEVSLYSQAIISEIDYIEKTKGKSKSEVREWLKILSKELKVDFISLKTNKPIECFHITDSFNTSSIIKEGFRVANDMIMDLGVGVYSFLETDEGIENIKDYMVDSDSEEITLFTLSYTGEYIRCIFGYGHEDYVVLKDEKKIIIENLSNMKVSDFLYEY